MQKDIIANVALKFLDNSMNGCVCYQAIDDKLYIAYCNENYLKMFDTTKERMDAFCVDIEKADKWGYLKKMLGTQDTYVYADYYEKKDLYLKIQAFGIDEDLICCVVNDVTEYEKAKDANQKLLNQVKASEEQYKYQVDLLEATQKQLTKSKKLYKLISEMSNDAFLYRDYISGDYRVSMRWHELFEVESEFDAEKFLVLLRPSDSKNFILTRESAVKVKATSYEMEFCLDKADRWIEADVKLIYNDKGIITDEIYFFKDITDLKQQKMELEHWAYFDILTGLYNRNYFSSVLEADIQRAKANNTSLYVMYIDIDDFKKTNDSLGFEVGDELILQFSKVLKKYKSSTVSISRFNSDEFVIAVYDGSKAVVERLYNDIRKHLEKPIHLSNGVDLYITISVGVVEYPGNGSTAIELIGNADIAMYEVKENGKNGIKFFEKTLLDKFLRNVLIENKLKRAIEEQSFEIRYQPQFDAISGVLRGVEALIRWKDGEEYIPPLQFIPIAEKNGSIVAIGNWVMRTALEDFREWKENYGYDGIMSINISPIQFKDKSFEETVKAFLVGSKTEPASLELEITESVFLDDMETTVELIKRLRNIGIKISLDDFGTGYSSLSYLKNIPIDTLKIDKSFIDTMISEETTNIITSSLIDMVQKLGFETIAEGVETEEQLRYLKQVNCDNIQGFLLGKPMTKENIIELLKKMK